jgi:hypothetical protein
MIGSNKFPCTKLYGFVVIERSPLEWATAPVDYEAIDKLRQYTNSKKNIEV